jgi:pyrroline-5-carboxylate reductase
MEMNPTGMKLGFVGTGTITEAVVTGLFKTRFRDAAIAVSPRNDEVAARLAATHPNVSIASSNQDLFDSSDIVFLAVRPQIVERDRHAAVSVGPPYHKVRGSNAS